MFDPVEIDIADYAVFCGNHDRWNGLVEDKVNSIKEEILDNLPEWAADVVLFDEDKLIKVAEQQLLKELDEEKTARAIADWEDKHFYLDEY